jgi:2-dehydropantoate 2-reductase
MKVAVLGAGAIGGYVGAALARGGADVTLIARGAHLRAIQSDGIHIISPRGDFSATPAATDSIDAISGADVVFLGLKAYSLPPLAAQIGAHLRPDAAVIAAQNGIPWWYFQRSGGPLNDLALSSVDPGGAISAAIDIDRVIGCVIYCSTEIVAPGVIRHIEGTRFSIGEPDGELSPRCRAISGAFTAGGLKCPIDPNLRDQIWLKLLGNAAFNPITALTGATLGQLGQASEMLEVLHSIMEECLAVASAVGATCRISLDRRVDAGIAVGNHKTSMLQDVEAGRPLELDCITGAVTELAHHLGIPVPHTRTVHECAQLLDSVRSSGHRQRRSID